MMAGIERRRVVADKYEKYERIQREIADNAVVDAAEEIIGHAWIAHLEELRSATAETVTEAAQNVSGARCLVRICQAAEEPQQLAAAQNLLERTQRDLARSMADSTRMLVVVEEQLDVLGRATAERVRRRLADLSRLQDTHGAVSDADADVDSLPEGLGT